MWHQESRRDWKRNALRKFRTHTPRTHVVTTGHHSRFGSWSCNNALEGLGRTTRVDALPGERFKAYLFDFGLGGQAGCARWPSACPHCMHRGRFLLGAVERCRDGPLAAFLEYLCWGPIFLGGTPGGIRLAHETRQLAMTTIGTTSAPHVRCSLMFLRAWSPDARRAGRGGEGVRIALRRSCEPFDTLIRARPGSLLWHLKNSHAIGWGTPCDNCSSSLRSRTRNRSVLACHNHREPDLPPMA